jgi:molecular chaperone GrpE
MSKKKAPDENVKDVSNASEGAENEADNAQKKESAAGEQQTEQADREVSKEDEELNVRYLRLAADFQNYKKRVEKEKGDIYAYANEKLVVELLDVIDNFERALEHSKDNCEGFAEGMSMIFKQFKGVLEKSGIEEMSALGELFDPNFHHAVMTENSVEYESGKVTLVLQKGYLLNKKVIRPAMVKVAE